MQTLDDLYIESFSLFMQKCATQGVDFRGMKLEEVKSQLHDAIYEKIEIFNATYASTKNTSIVKYRVPQEIPACIIAEAMLRREYVRRVCLEDSSSVLAIYDADSGLYRYDEIFVRREVRKYNRNASKKDIDNVLSDLNEQAKTVDLTMDYNLIVVQNGIYDLRKKQLLPFSPDYVFLGKCKVPYNPLAVSPVIIEQDNSKWEVQTWLESLSDDPGIVNLLWMIIAKIIRPYYPLDKSFLLYSEIGANGKGTFCTLLKNLLGPENFLSLNMENFEGEFALENLLGALAVIADENPVGSFNRKIDKYKAAVTGDHLNINRKGKPNITARFYGTIVQCVNDFPRVSDKSDSFTRRLVVIPFDKSFSGAENKNIKHDYLCREDVLEYVMKVAVETDISNFEIPERCGKLLAEWKSYNNPILQFKEDVIDGLMMNCKYVAIQFLYDTYKAWFRKENPSGTIEGKTSFVKRLKAIMRDDTVWEFPETPEWFSTKDESIWKYDGWYLIVKEYSLDEWISEVNHRAKDHIKYMPMKTGAMRVMKKRM